MHSIHRISSSSAPTHRPKFRLVEVKSARPRRARPRLWTILLAAAGLLAASVTIGFTLFVLGNDSLKNTSVLQVLASLEDPPVYPGAQQVKVVSSDLCRKAITFTSDDTNEQISAFYEEALSKRGWKHPYSGPSRFGDFRYTSPSGNDLTISFIGYSKKEVKLAADCDTRWFPAESSQTAAPTPPTVNITRQEYEEALAKWNASGIEEYQISVSTYAFLGIPSTLRVSNHGESILELYPSPRPPATPDPEYIEYTKEHTVEGMFAEVKGYLNSETIIHSGAMVSTGSFYMAYTVEFDSDLGYPVRLSGHPVTAPSVYVDDADWEEIVTELRILKRSTPTP